MFKRSPEQLIVIGICIVCLTGLVPFTFIRLFSGEYVVAIIDFIGVVTSVFGIRYVWKTGKTQGIGTFIALIALVGMTANTMLLSRADLYFLYPVFISAFFLATPAAALVLTLLSTLTISYYLSPSLTNLELAKVGLSLFATALFTFIFATQRNRQRDAMQKLSRTDSLTQAGNRIALRDHLEKGVAASQRDGHLMSLLIIDLDDFKNINDQFGHLAGDQLLREFADRIRLRIRATDHLFRLGGDEFIVLANHASAETANKLAAELQLLVADSFFSNKLTVTASFGVSQYRLGETVDQWIARTDDAMYGAKKLGKNQVVEAELSAVQMIG
ncbi:GGDEF domain-containing protein [Reinekea marina]|uniref:diguanylate cyclase n=2 Tax=Reinekea marina TaxID=1310421 RepID=A0ABV7WTA7_9GAMM